MSLHEINRKEAKRILLLSTLVGKIMLKNGAETYRIEDTIERICKSRKNVKYVNAFVTPTGIFLSLEYCEEMISYLVRIKSRKIDLNKIDLVNKFSREFVNSQLSINKSIEKLKGINKITIYSKSIKALFGSLACGFFSILFGGSLSDFIASWIVSFVVLLTINKIDKDKMAFFINDFVGATLTSILSILTVHIGIGQNMDIIIIGSIMCLVPGVAVTNAMRDTMSGDFVSGLSRGMEAIFSALAIAFGVGMVLNIYLKGLMG